MIEFRGFRITSVNFVACMIMVEFGNADGTSDKWKSSIDLIVRKELKYVENDLMCYTHCIS